MESFGPSRDYGMDLSLGPDLVNKLISISILFLFHGFYIDNLTGTRIPDPPFSSFDFSVKRQLDLETKVSRTREL
jgi:hypothetical protein